MTDLNEIAAKPVNMKQINTLIICGLILGLALGFYAGHEWAMYDLQMQLLDRPDIICRYTNESLVTCVNNLPRTFNTEDPVFSIEHKT